MSKDSKERLIELIKSGIKMHDATVRLINDLAEETEISNAMRKRKMEDK